MFFNNILKDAKISTTKVTDGSKIYALADSLQAVFNQLHLYPHHSLTPHQAADELLQLPGSSFKSDDGSDFSDYETGQISGFECYSIGFDSLSYEQMFKVQDILLNLDYSDFSLLYNDNQQVYGQIKNDRINEFVWYSAANQTISFLYGNLNLPNKKGPVFTVTNNNGLQLKRGGYLLLKCAEWRFGMNNENLNQIMKDSTNAPYQITIAPIINNGNRVKLGSPIKLSLSSEQLDSLDLEWKEQPDAIIFRGLRKARRIQ